MKGGESDPSRLKMLKYEKTSLRLSHTLFKEVICCFGVFAHHATGQVTLSHRKLCSCTATALPEMPGLEKSLNVCNLCESVCNSHYINIWMF